MRQTCEVLKLANFKFREQLVITFLVLGCLAEGCVDEDNSTASLDLQTWNPGRTCRTSARKNACQSSSQFNM
ncbi:hypothetical protein EDB19DRAFT_1762220 [Suillus lakei]|nr:hypothetical protein EDB19DRAFT_1762220 [Suillus lakei]